MRKTPPQSSGCFAPQKGKREVEGKRGTIFMLTHTMEAADPVRANTDPAILAKIDRTIEQQVRYYSAQPREVISARIAELDREWDIERVLETNAATLGLAGLALGVTVSRKYLALTGLVLGFLLTHAIQGWCPPMPVLRKLGVRTRAEIDREKFALKILRGDFQEISSDASDLVKDTPGQALKAVKL